MPRKLFSLLYTNDDRNGPLATIFSCMIPLEEHYVKIAQVGQGTYGQVFKAHALTNRNTLFALKKIRMETEKEGFPVTAVREIKLLQSLHHPHLITLHQMAYSQSGSIYMVFEYMPYDLAGLLRHLPESVSTREVVQSVMRQVFEALDYLHGSERILHRDLKPSNILLDRQGNVKLADFGLARTITQYPPWCSQKENCVSFLTNRVCTIWYRAPELLLGSTTYDASADVWSAGCVMAELLNRRTLFAKTDEFTQLEAITKKLGVSVEESDYLRGLPWGYLRPVDPFLRECIIYSMEDNEAEDLLVRCLRIKPEDRITAREALEHPFLKNVPIVSLDRQLPQDLDLHEFECKQREKIQRNNKPL